MISWLDIQHNLLDQIRINIDFNISTFIENLHGVTIGLLAQNAFKCLKSALFALAMMYLVLHSNKFANILHGLSIHGGKLTYFDLTYIFFFKIRAFHTNHFFTFDVVSQELLHVESQF